LHFESGVHWRLRSSKCVNEQCVNNLCVFIEIIDDDDNNNTGINELQCPSYSDAELDELCRVTRVSFEIKLESVGILGSRQLICDDMLMQEKATKWYSEGEIDGLTTNGILIMNPLDGFAGNSKPGIWREVSVDGGIYALRESRSTPQKSSLVCLHCVVCCIV